MAEYRKAIVFVQDVPAGEIAETEDGYEFCYYGSYCNSGKPAVSLTLPITEKKYSSNTLFPFFDGLIPEGWLLEIVIKNWKLNPEDRFGLLCVACRDCIGDVSIRMEVE